MSADAKNILRILPVLAFTRSSARRFSGMQGSLNSATKTATVTTRMKSDIQNADVQPKAP